VGLRPILGTTTSFSALTLLVGSFDPYKPVPDMTYNVFSGTLNPTQSILNQSRSSVSVTSGKCYYDSCVLAVNVSYQST